MYVDVVITGIGSFDTERRILFLYCFETMENFAFNVWLNVFPSIPRTPYEVILDFVDGVVEGSGSHVLRLAHEDVCEQGTIHPRTRNGLLLI